MVSLKSASVDNVCAQEAVASEPVSMTVEDSDEVQEPEPAPPIERPKKKVYNV